MNTSPKGPRDQAQIDQEHLRLLSIFNFVAAALAFFWLLFVIGHYVFFFRLLVKSGVLQRSGMPLPPEDFIALMRGVYWVCGVWFAVSALGNLLSGIFLRRHTYRVFCLVVAAIDCVYMPLGTVLGVFTFIVLARDSVRKLYETQ